MIKLHGKCYSNYASLTCQLSPRPSTQLGLKYEETADISGYNHVNTFTKL